MPGGGRGTGTPLGAPLDGFDTPDATCTLCRMPVPGGGRGNLIVPRMQGLAPLMLLASVPGGLLAFTAFTLAPLSPPGPAGEAAKFAARSFGANGIVVFADCMPTALVVLEAFAGFAEAVVVAFEVTSLLCCCCISLTAEAACMLMTQLLPLIWTAASWAPLMRKDTSSSYVTHRPFFLIRRFVPLVRRLTALRDEASAVVKL